MHGLAPLITDLTIILGVASLVMLICHKLKQPLVLGYLIAGIIVGPYTPGLLNITDNSTIQVIAELGVIFLMFSLGLEFSFHKLRKVGAPASITGFIEVFVMLGIGYLLGIVLGWTKVESLFLGSALAISSTTIILKAMTELHLKKTHFAELIFGVLIIEDLLAILLLVALSSFALTHDSMGSGFFVKALIRLVLVVGGWFLIGYFLVPTLFRRWLKEVSNEILIVVSVALCLLLVSLAAYHNYSVALGAFIMGSILAETQDSHRIEALIQPLRDVFAAVFFVSVGMLIDPLQIWAHIGTVLIITVVTIFGKIIASGAGALASRQSPLTALQIGFGMAQIGEFSFIITALGVSMGLLSQAFYPIIVAVAVITTFTTPYLIQLSVKSASLFQKHSQFTTALGHKEPKFKNNAVSNDIKQFSARLILNGIIVAIIFILSHRYLWPILDAVINPYTWAKPFDFIVTYILVSPFLFAMFFALKLSKNSHFKLRSLLLCRFIAFFMTVIELYILIKDHLNLPGERLAWILAMLVLTLIFKPYLMHIYFWFENHLTGNIKDHHEEK